MKNKTLNSAERIQNLALHLNLSIRAFSRAVEMSEVTMYHVTDGSRPITDRTASRICYHLERKYGIYVNRNWLMTGEGEMILEGMPQPVVAELDKAAEDSTEFTDWRSKYFELLEQFSDLQRRYTALLEQKQ